MVKKNTDQKQETPILAYSSFTEKELLLTTGTREAFSDYAEFFSEKGDYSVTAEDVISAKATELFSNPRKIEVAPTVQKNMESLLLPNSAWAGIAEAVKVHASSPEIVLEALAKKLEEQSDFLRWRKKKRKGNTKSQTEDSIH